MKEQPIVGILLIVTLILFKQKLPWPIKIVWGYFLTVTALHTFWPYYVPTFAPTFSNVLAWNGALAFVYMLVYPLVVLNSSDRFKEILITCIKWYMVYDSVVLLCGANGVFSATTFDATLISCFVLFWDLKKWYDWIGLLTCIAAIVFVKARDAELIIAVNLTVMAWIQGYWKLSLGLILTVAASIISVSRIAAEPRFEMWQSFMTWWQQNADQWQGTGLGSFEWVGPYLDPGSFYRGQHLGFYVAHNDWLQLLFESGYVGLLFGLLGFLFVAWKLRGRYLAAWLGIGVGMCFYYPTHAWPVQILSLFLIEKVRVNEEHFIHL